MADITWNPIRIKLGQIIPWSENPRMSTKAQAQRLIKSERELGQIQTLAVSPFEDGKVYLYDGHQRCAAWMTVKDASYEVTALQSNRMLTEDERKKVSVLLHTATGSWSWEALSSWSAADLREWGMDESTLKGWNTDALNLHEMLNSENGIPSLDELAERYGETGERDFYPYVRVQVTPETFTKYNALMAEMPGADDAEKFDALISRGG